MPPAPVPRPVRALVVALLVVVALYAGMAAVGVTTPKLGLDLRGGTSVVLTPRATEGGQVSKEALGQAVEIIRQRVNGLGVAESEVATEGDNIVISVPGRGQDEVVALVGQTAQLRFREVLQEAPPGPPPGTRAPTSPRPGASVGTQPTPSPRPRGRALSKGLTALAPARAPGPAAADNSADLAPRAQTVADLQKRFAGLDCTKPETRRGGGTDDAQAPIVACDRSGSAKYLLAKADVLGTAIKDATAGPDQNGIDWQVNVSFDDEGAKKFRALTQRTVGKQVAIVLDGVVVSTPRINEPILGGQAQITGNFSQKEASDLANVLRYGALPLAFDRSEARSISPTLGSDQLRAGLLASAIGMALVVLYSLLYYRGLALVAVLSLVVSALLTYATVVLLGETIGFTLTLAGIAGLIVAIGITADSFIVYFERLRDEVREGRALRTAVERSWPRARRTILSADFVSFLAAAVLYVLAVGNVRGFAFTLGLTTVIDVFIVFVVTKPLMTLLARTRFFGGGHPLSGLDPVRLGAKPAGAAAAHVAGLVPGPGTRKEG